MPDLPANEPWFYITDGNYTNPLTGNAVDSVIAANATATDATLKIVVLKDNTP